MKAWIKERLAEQGTLSGLALLGIMALAARAAGIDLGAVGAEIAGLAASLGALAAAAKTVLRDNAPPAPRPEELFDPVARRVAELLRRDGDGLSDRGA